MYYLVEENLTFLWASFGKWPCLWVAMMINLDLSRTHQWISHQPELYLPQLISTKLSFFWGTLYIPVIPRLWRVTGLLLAPLYISADHSHITNSIYSIYYTHKNIKRCCSSFLCLNIHFPKTKIMFFDSPQNYLFMVRTCDFQPDSLLLCHCVVVAKLCLPAFPRQIALYSPCRLSVVVVTFCYH